LQVVVRGKVVPVVGYGGMNLHIIDVSTVPEAQVNGLPFW
jgi:alanine racemase